MSLKEAVVFGHTPPEEPEETLIALAVGGDEGAFTKLFDSHYDRVFRYVYYRVGGVEDAEDLTQKAFLQAWRALPRYRRTEVPFLAWLYTIARNLTASFFRSHKPADYLQFDLLDKNDAAHPDLVAEDLDEQQRIRSAILQLSPDQQQVITLRFLEGFEYGEIAAALGKTEGNVRVIQHRGLQQLRKLLERRYPIGKV